MNDSDLENQLRALSPAAPSPDLATRIERDLGSTPRVAQTAGVLARPARAPVAWRWLRDLGWAAAGAATMLAVVTHFSSPKKREASLALASAPVSIAPVAAEQAFEPAETSRELVSVKNSDELLDTADGPVREVRYTYLERLAWAHPLTGARLEIEVPREDVYLLPVSLQ
jgi:hypothetical protein